jgi:Zn-dependent peptidase ImmA (M78 family)/DNA-binding XRE family transcriptional regulator
MTIFGERIKQARALSGLTQDELADRVGISQSMIAHIETSRVTPSQDVVQAIAKETEVQTSFFEQIPIEDFPISSLVYRARLSLTAGERDKAYQYTKLCVEQVRKMAPRLNLPDLNLPKSNRDAVATAKLMRIILGTEPTKPILNLINLLERSGIIVIALPFDLEKLDAFSCWSNFVVERPVIAVCMQKPGDRLRFNIAHEFGHILLHKGLYQPTPDSEKEANTFAGEFLLPEVAMRGTLSDSLNLTQAARLKLRWGVSMQALIRRAYELKIITERRYHYLFEQIGRMGWKKREPENLDIPVEKPRSFKKMVELLYGQAHDKEEFALSLHISYRMADQMLSEYANCIPPVRIEDTEEYISSRQNHNPN